MNEAIQADMALSALVELTYMIIAFIGGSWFWKLMIIAELHQFDIKRKISHSESAPIGPIHFITLNFNLKRNTFTNAFKDIEHFN